MLLFLVACQPDVQVAPDSHTPSWQDTGVDSATEPVFTPQEGEWVVRSSQMTLDECGLEQHSDRGTPGNILRVVRTGESAFEVTLAGGETPACDLVDTDYDCVDFTEYDETANSFGLDATMPAVVSVSGRFESETEMMMRTDVYLECSGDGCDLVSWFLDTTFPCSMSMDSWIDAG